MTDFLLEILSEEIPARMQEKAAADLVRLFEAEIGKAGLKAASIESFVTPRRLALIARDLPQATEAVSEEVKGPRADAPEQALAGFLGKTGLTRDQLVEREDAKGNKVLFAVIEKPGRPTAEVLAEAVPAVIRAFPWPKSMRWGAASLSTESQRWVRPLQGIVALLGQDVVPFEVAGIASNAVTVGHRFHHPQVVTIGSAADYAEKLRACHVIVDAAERQGIVRDGARAAAQAAGLTLVEDEGLVAENAGLTEWPVPLLGHFDPAFLDVPREVIQLTMRTNQKYFACTDAGGALAPAFVCTANIAAVDGGAQIVAGNAKVLAARLADARFFWEQDLKIPLAENARKLDQIVFHEKLGTVADKVERVAKLARWLVEEGIVKPEPLPFRGGVGVGPRPLSDASSAEAPHPPTPSPEREGEVARLADLAEQAARLCKADLVTGMVGEFPELQGVMGGYYAAAEGLDPAVAAAIRDHYKPVGQGDDVPTAPVTVAVSLADKLDTLIGFFVSGEQPSGSRDPLALRRSALGLLAQWLLSVRSPVTPVIAVAATPFLPSEADGIERGVANADHDFFQTYSMSPVWFEAAIAKGANAVGIGAYTRNNFFGGLASVGKFLIDRLKVQQREAGVRHDLIDAVFALGGEDDLVRLLARVKALQAFVETEDGKNLLAGYRRAANILRAEAKKDGQEAGAFTGFSYPPEPAEQALAEALDRQLPIAENAIGNEAFEAAMAALAAVRPHVDRFFDDVTVNAPDKEQRAERLALLGRLVAAMHNVADFSKIEG